MSQPANVLAGEPSREDFPGQSARSWVGRLFLTIPLVLVNAAAIWGQAGWAYEKLAAGIVVAVLFAVAVESIGVYLAWEAHEARLGDREYFGKQLASYAVGAFAGYVNYQHFAEINHTQAVVFGVLSALSPWLWCVYSQAQNKERLHALGLLDTRGVKLSAARKIWHPGRSLNVIRWAAWEGVKNPAEAVNGWELDHDPEAIERRAKREEAQELPAEVSPIRGRSAEQTRAAIRVLQSARPGITQKELSEELKISDRRIRQVLKTA